MVGLFNDSFVDMVKFHHTFYVEHKDEETGNLRSLRLNEAAAEILDKIEVTGYWYKNYNFIVRLDRVTFDYMLNILTKHELLDVDYIIREWMNSNETIDDVLYKAWWDLDCH